MSIILEGVAVVVVGAFFFESDMNKKYFSNTQILLYNILISE